MLQPRSLPVVWIDSVFSFIHSFISFSLRLLHLKWADIPLISSHQIKQTWHTSSIRYHTANMRRHARTHTPPPQSAATSSAFPGATARLKALCHFHHERVSCKTTNFSLFNFCSFRQMHLFFRAGHEYFRAEWHIQWRMKRERRGGGVGESREVWVIKFGFCRSHKALQISIRLPHSWPSLLISSVIAPRCFPSARM